MQAQLRHDSARGAGYGIIDLKDFEGQEMDILFSLCRASDGKYLAAGGWLEAEQRLAPDKVQLLGDRLRLLVGPAVVDMLDMLDTFAITAYLADGEGRRYGLEIGDLVYSNLAGGQGITQSASASLSMSPMPEMLLDPAPKPQPESLLPPDPEPALGPPLPELQDPVEHKSKAPLILLLLAFACAAGGVYWWESKSAASIVNATTPATNATAPASQAAPAPSADTAPTAPPSALSAPVPQAVSAPVPAPFENLPPLQRARELLRAGILPEHAVETAKSMQTPAGADGAFLLLEDAAQKGKPEAMLGLARFYDPADAAPKGSIRSDPEQARDWYNKAKDKGQSAADDKLKALRTWAEAEKDRNPQAKSLLESWK